MPERKPLVRRSATAEVRKAAEAAAEVFRVRDWTWGGAPWSDQPKHRPTADEIEKRLHGLIGNLIASEDAGEGHSSSTGRLYIQWGDEGDLHISMDLGTVEHFFEADHG